MTEQDAIDWTQVQALYCNGKMPVRDISAEFGISRAQIYRKAEAQGWPLRSQKRRALPQPCAAPARPETPEPAPESEAEPSELGDTGLKAVGERLLALFQRQVAQVEAALAGGAANAADRERDTRTLGTLMRSYEKLRDMNLWPDQQGGALNDEQLAQDGLEHEARCRQIIERLEELAAEGADLPASPEA